MTEQQHQQYLEFIHTTLYETLSIEDYYSVMDSLDIPRKGNRLKSACHNIDLSHADYNLAFVEKYRTFTCHSTCQQSYSLLSLVEKRFKLIGEPKSNTQCMRYICNVCNIPFNFTDIELPKPMEYNWKKALGRYMDDDYVEEIDEPIIDNSILSSFEDKYYQGWIDEGISVDTMKKYGIKWYGFRKQIIIPARNSDGSLIGIRARNMLPSPHKYYPLITMNKHQYNFATNNSLYGLWYTKQAISRRKKAVIVESEKSVLQLESLYGDDNYSVALYGKSISERKKMLLLELGISEIVLGLDFDYDTIFESDGKTKTADFIKYMKSVIKIYEVFAPFVKVTLLLSNSGHKKNQSPTDYDKDKFEWTYKNRFMISKDKDKYSLTHKGGYVIMIEKGELK